MFKLFGNVINGFGSLVNAFAIGCGAVEKVAISVDQSLDLVNESVQKAIKEAAAERDEDLKTEEEVLKAKLAAIKAAKKS